MDKERFWRKQVLDQARSDLTARAYCRAHGLLENSFYGWRRTLGEWDRRAAHFGALSSPLQFGEVVLNGRNEGKGDCRWVVFMISWTQASYESWK